MTDSFDIAERAGLAVLGQEGTSDEVRAVWRYFASVSAVPAVRISDSDDDPLALERSWAWVMTTTELVSPSGEFLLSVSAPGSFDLPWLRVRSDDEVRVRQLGLYDGEPDFVATDLDRTVAVAVTSEEDETWVLVASGDSMPTGDRLEPR